MKCFLCQEAKAITQSPTKLTGIVQCEYCGNYEITIVATRTLGVAENVGVAMDLSSWTFQQSRLGMQPTGVSSQAFVAMSFDESLKEAYEKGFSEGVIGSGYSPMRVDRKEYHGRIDDEIIAELRRSAFIIADFTFHRGGVYYEAGFAHGLGRPVIFTCRSDELSKLHFDVRQYNTITWATPSEVIAPLQNRILALFGAGAFKPDAR